MTGFKRLICQYESYAGWQTWGPKLTKISDDYTIKVGYKVCKCIKIKIKYTFMWFICHIDTEVIELIEK